MNIKQVSLILIAFLCMSFGLPKNIQKKVDKVVKEVFDVETFQFTSVSISKGLVSTLPSKFAENNLFKIENDSVLLGYAYISKAASKTDEFDYLVVLDADLIVIKTKILVYREDFGSEIGSKRWLKQFIGKTKTDEVNKTNIVAISGATISVRSMTNAMNNLLKSIHILHSKNIL